MNKPLKYLGYSVVFQEVPNETSLAINISGCPHKCEGCHSQYLWEYRGNNLIEDIESIIDRYENFVTCVCLMGGDQNLDELLELIRLIKIKGLKTCIYSGLDEITDFTRFIPYLDYLKIGHYQEESGGLDEMNTNQIFYQITDGGIKDITSAFWNKECKDL